MDISPIHDECNAHIGPFVPIQSTKFREFNSAVELMAHYRALKKRMRDLKPPTAVVEIQEVVVPPFKQALALDPVPQPFKYPRISRIQKIVAAFYGVTLVDLLSQRKTNDVVLIRQVACHLCKVLTLHSYPEIGRRMGGRDHTTVIWADKKVSMLLKTDRELVDEIAYLKEAIATWEACYEGA